MPLSLDESYLYCKRLSRRTGRNFYFSFLTLPADRSRAMCALYAFMRVCDDLADNPEETVAQKTIALRNWRDDLGRAFDGDASGHEVFPALTDAVQRFDIPQRYFSDVIDGVEADLKPRRFETFAELSQYCYQVAGAVGLCCLHVWGFHDDKALERAIDCGIAFQLTNILRDIGEDAAMGRVYLPLEDLRRFDFSEEDIARHCRDERFRRLMQFEVERAKSYYTRAQELITWLDRPGKPIFSAMMRIYGGLLHEIERRDYDVFTKRVTLSRWRKLRISAGAIVRYRLFRC